MQIGGEAAAKCWVIGRLEFTMSDASSWLRTVTGRMVTKMPGGEAVGKCRVMWGFEVGVPGLEAMGEHCEYVRELSPWLIGLQ